MAKAAYYDYNSAKRAGKIATEILWELRELLEPGIKGDEINFKAGELCAKKGVKSSFLGVKGAKSNFPGNLCLSINNMVLHGIPSAQQIIKEGDLVKLDFGIIDNGCYTDQCVTVGVGKVAPQDEKLLEVGRKAVLNAALKAKMGEHVGTLGYTMQGISELGGFSVVKEYVGHGIGNYLHLPPEVPAWGDPGKGAVLKEGMVICVEAQVLGSESDEVYTAKDGWSIFTVDGANSVMFEYMVYVGKDEARILTPTQDWPLIKSI